MQIGASARLDLAEIDHDDRIACHETQQSGLLFTGPASNTGAYRGGHRNRLTLLRLCGIPSRAPSRVNRRLPSWDGSRGLKCHRGHSSAVLRWQTQIERAEDQVGPVSERISMRQPVSLAASRAF
jgi:hypothetical protein